MNKYKGFSIKQIESDFAASANNNFSPLHSINNEEVKLVSKLIQLPDTEELSTKVEGVLGKVKQKKQSKVRSVKYPSYNEEASIVTNSTLFRLFVKNGEYVYARPHDILMIESCDHMVKVYLLVNDKPKKTIRHNTLKDFLLQLPQNQFVRIGRFCAVNTQRISGGNCNDQTFEFDFKISIKLKHAISQSAFSNIGT
jgi:DNA-binding LytR/AlgR family response regulator